MRLLLVGATLIITLLGFSQKTDGDQPYFEYVDFIGIGIDANVTLGEGWLGGLGAYGSFEIGTRIGWHTLQYAINVNVGDRKNSRIYGGSTSLTYVIDIFQFGVDYSMVTTDLNKIHNDHSAFTPFIGWYNLLFSASIGYSFRLNREPSEVFRSIPVMRFTIRSRELREYAMDW